ncbi:hypothetical protein PR048_033122 [Dryococelus australis]|uniref:Uncharacterized protein n=1 Tax=Dryococelus australis TaxID=614101 RepID=A0ABQ9G2H8_9NEOP|nr:hypothetical protein PR048_033122 [Dryococelus australis]
MYRHVSCRVVKSVELGLTSSELPPPVLDQIVRAVKRGYNHATARRIEAGLHPYVDVTVRSIDFGDYISQIP